MSHRVAGLRQRKKEKTRRALVDTAMRLFAERGYDETTIADLASATEVSPRTFFSYFPAKEDLLFADVNDRIAALSRLEFGPPGQPLRDGLRRAAEQYVQWVMTDSADARTEIGRRTELMRQIIESRPSLQAALLLRLRAADRMLASKLHAAFPDDLDEVLAAAVVAALTAGLRAAAEAQPGTPLSDCEPWQVFDRVLRLLEHGLGP
jgi:AcrR family transcriptional regulator